MGRRVDLPHLWAHAAPAGDRGDDGPDDAARALDLVSDDEPAGARRAARGSRPSVRPARVGGGGLQAGEGRPRMGGLPGAPRSGDSAALGAGLLCLQLLLVARVARRGRDTRGSRRARSAATGHGVGGAGEKPAPVSPLHCSRLGPWHSAACARGSPRARGSCAAGAGGRTCPHRRSSRRYSPPSRPAAGSICTSQPNKPPLVPTGLRRESSGARGG